MLKAISKILMTCGIAMTTFMQVCALDLPVKHINGKAFYYYRVDKKDRPYSLAEKLGIKVSDIAKYNPQAKDGFQSGMMLTFPVTIDAKVNNGYYTTTYTPSKDETVYGLAKRFDIPVERLIAFNPQATQSIHNSTLIIPLQPAGEIVNEPKPVTSAQPTQIDDEEDIDNVPAQEPDESLTQIRTYTIAKGETLSKIARENDITVQDILAMNPKLNPHKYQAGERILLPPIISLDEPQDAIATPQSVQQQSITQQSIPVQQSQTVVIDDIPQNTANEEIAFDTIDKITPLSIGIMFPFMLNEEEESKSAKLFTEFYRGFLLATKELSQSGQPIKIYAYDTSASLDSVTRILNHVSSDTINIFIGPDDQTALSRIGRFAASNNGYVLNMFAVKDDSYKYIPSIIQANIPHDYMYDKAIKGFIEKYKDKTPVFLSRAEGNNDKIEFVNKLKSELKKKGIIPIDLTFENSLTSENLDELSLEKSYVFIPASGNASEFTKFAPALNSFRKKMTSPDKFALFGYPEWVMFRNERLDYLHALNTTIYSRFFTSTDSPLADKIASEYNDQFGIDMLEAVPSQGLLGYDTAIFLIKSLRNNEGNFSESSMAYDGVQSGFDLCQPAGVKGLVNLNLYFITFGPRRSTTKVQL
ncbi:MAG: LysM peptidoglycan-binding domain-containing protein [Muribaculaceae bacterium]|nr:LysM peptidoglycan-binding domain-containing protein [Muribaculaceae bacterium]MDE7370021.1 LysM peptidoglycan-binding domain-containing protein [Muribaculaceae bacterium]